MKAIKISIDALRTANRGVAEAKEDIGGSGGSPLERRILAVWTDVLDQIEKNLEISNTEPVLLHLPEHIVFEGCSNVWLFRNFLFDVKGALSDEDQKLLVMEAADMERQRFESVKASTNRARSNTGGDKSCCVDERPGQVRPMWRTRKSGI
jgi:hypothetical protein